jgi:hypothetical protein
MSEGHSSMEDIHSLHEISIASSDFSAVREVRNQRSSSTSSRSPNSNSNSNGNGTLDDPNFAPPPILSISEDKPMYEFNTMHVDVDTTQRCSELPSMDKIRHSGYIMTRFSAATRLTKKWKQNFWILYEESLCFFRSKEAFEEWLLNPYLSKGQRQALIKRHLEFKSKSLKMYSLGEKRMKHYRRCGYMHLFKLDKHCTYGEAITPVNVGDFASLNEIDVIELHTIITSLLRPTSAKKRYRANSNFFPLSDTNSKFFLEGCVFLQYIHV